MFSAIGSQLVNVHKFLAESAGRRNTKFDISKPLSTLTQNFCCLLTLSLQKYLIDANLHGLLPTSKLFSPGCTKF